MKTLKPGSKIAIICPSSPSDLGSFDFFINSFPKFEFIINPLCYDKTENLDIKHAEVIENYFSDKTIAAILCGRGGYGTIRKLELLNYDLIKKNPKPFFGFSDSTALQMALYKKSKIKSYTGLLAKITPSIEDSKTLLSSFKQIIEGIPQTIKNIKLIGADKIEGKIIGGNLATIASLVGTPYLPNFKNKILVLEEVEESPYRIDRMLYQLYLAGVFDGIKALCFGGLTNCVNPKYPDGKSAISYIEDFVKKLSCPIIYNFPYGHYDQRIMFKLGAKCKISKDEMIIY